MKKNLEIGQIVNTFGIKGFVKVVPYVDNIERYDEIKKVYVKNKNITEEYEIEEVKYQKNMVLLKLKGIDKVEDAEKLRNAFLEVDRENAKKLEEGEYFIADLIGMQVITDKGQELGTLEDIYNRGSSDIYVVKDELGKTILLPAIEDVIKEINLEESKITVHIIEGLI